LPGAEELQPSGWGHPDADRRGGFLFGDADRSHGSEETCQLSARRPAPAGSGGHFHRRQFERAALLRNRQAEHPLAFQICFNGLDYALQGFLPRLALAGDAHYGTVDYKAAFLRRFQNNAVTQSSHLPIHWVSPDKGSSHRHCERSVAISACVRCEIASSSVQAWTDSSQ